MKDSEIDTEILAIIESRMTSSLDVAGPWLIHEVVNQHPNIEGDDEDFYRCCAFGHVAARVREALRREAQRDNSEDRQLLLPGWSHLHRRYSIERNDQQMIVPIEAMTDLELEKKAAEYIRQSDGLRSHADEINRYRMQRRSMTA